MCFLRNILKCAVPAVPVKNVVTEVRHKQVGMAVVVVIADADALRPAFRGKPGFHRDIGKTALPLIAIELQMRMNSRLRGIESRTVPDENVVAPVAIIVEDSGAVPGRFQFVFFETETT